MNERIEQLWEDNDTIEVCYPEQGSPVSVSATTLEKFAQLIVRECIDKIETHRIPVGNSAAGEMACEWTYAALKEIRDDIKEHFGVEL